MKKHLKWLSCVITAVLTLSAVTVLGAGCKDGKKISDPQEFIDTIKEDPKADLYLDADLDFSGIDWEPLEYHGTLKGNGHTISNITIEEVEGDNIGIFSFGRFSIENLKIEKLSVTYLGTGSNIGGLVGYWGTIQKESEGFFDDCITDVEISGTVNAIGATNVGGVVGFQHCGDTDNSFGNVTSRVDVTGSTNVGGIVGQFNWNEDWYYSNSGYSSVIKKAVNYGSVTAMKETAGGIIGFNTDSAVYEKCWNHGTIKAKTHVGGIVGNAQEAEFLGCTNDGSVHALGNAGMLEEAFAGGIVGYQQEGRIAQCTNKGEVSAKYSACGGIVGCQEDCKEILACTNQGKVSADQYVGGIAGSLKGSNMLVSTCKNEGMISGTDFVAGIVGVCLSNLGSIISNESQIAHMTNCENSGDIYGIGEWIGAIGAGSVWGTGTEGNNKNTGNLYRNGIIIE